MEFINLLEELDNTIIELDQLEDIEYNEDVENVEFNGISGKDGSSKWYSVFLNNGNEYQLYTA